MTLSLFFSLFFLLSLSATTASGNNYTTSPPLITDGAAMFPDLASTMMAAAAAPTPPPPAITPADIAAARRLVAEAIWGVLCSIDYTAGSPFGNVVSYADGGSGTPYFYLTRRDRKTVGLAELNPNSSLAISQYGVDRCPVDLDPQEPPCSRVTLGGRLLRLDPASPEGVFAGAALLKRHPRFDRLPAVVNFQLFKLDLNQPIYLINSYARSPKDIPVAAYLNFNFTA